MATGVGRVSILWTKCYHKEIGCVCFLFISFKNSHLVTQVITDSLPDLVNNNNLINVKCSWGNQTWKWKLWISMKNNSPKAQLGTLFSFLYHLHTIYFGCVQKFPVFSFFLTRIRKMIFYNSVSRNKKTKVCDGYFFTYQT